MSKFDDLVRLEQAATPAPWHLDENGYVCDEDGDIGDSVRDWQLLIAARNALPALLELARAAERIVAEGCGLPTNAQGGTCIDRGESNDGACWSCQLRAALAKLTEAK